MAAEVVPGILVTNRTVKVANPCLRDLTPTILKEFGVTPPKEMTGRAVF
jgi:bisphosphoglycerate-independent phosphoglycerate mutase (AlkP superfamily)